MEKVSHNYVKNQSLFNCFLTIKDPRVRGRCTYPLINILVIALCALISGANNWESISQFGKMRFRWLSRYIDMNVGVPSPLTFARVFSLIEPSEFKKCFTLWMGQLFTLVKFDMIHIDGKSLCDSARKTQNKKATHIVNAYLPKEQVTLGEVRVLDKTNEIKAIPILLKKLSIKDCIITIDAMGTQKGIANLIRLKQAHYVLTLKKNHKKFYRYVDRIFSKSDEIAYANMVTHVEKINNYGHGRIEQRKYTLLPMMYFYKYKKVWRDLQAIIRVQTTRCVGEKIENSTRYYITSLPFTENLRMYHSIRQHWSIENNLHWKLDVGLGEDVCLATRGHAAENLSTMRKLILKLLEDEETSKNGIGMKRLKAAMSTRYLQKVIGF